MASWIPGASIAAPLLALCGAPLFVGVVNRTKAIVAGRRGPPLLQLYFDLVMLLRKDAVYSQTTTWIFRAAPVAALSGALLAAFLVPLGGVAAPLSFTGDLVLLAGIVALVRFATVLAALDAGSSFEGREASREAQLGTIVEPALLVGLAALARATELARAAVGRGLPESVHPLSLAALAQGVDAQAWIAFGPALALLAGALVLVLLAENCRIPFDDPTTHLELTTVHEVMALDHGGPDLGFLLYAAAVKLWVFAALVVNLIVPVRSGSAAVDLGAALLGMAGLAVAIGLVESAMARLRLVRVPQLLVAAGALSALAAILTLRGGAS